MPPGCWCLVPDVLDLDVYPQLFSLSLSPHLVLMLYLTCSSSEFFLYLKHYIPVLYTVTVMTSGRRTLCANCSRFFPTFHTLKNIYDHLKIFKKVLVANKFMQKFYSADAFYSPLWHPGYQADLFIRAGSARPPAFSGSTIYSQVYSYCYRIKISISIIFYLQVTLGVWLHHAGNPSWIVCLLFICSLSVVVFRQNCE